MAKSLLTLTEKAYIKGIIDYKNDIKATSRYRTNSPEHRAWQQGQDDERKIYLRKLAEEQFEKQK